MIALADPVQAQTQIGGDDIEVTNPAGDTANNGGALNTNGADIVTDGCIVIPGSISSGAIHSNIGISFGTGP